MASLVLGVVGGVAGFVVSGGNPMGAMIGFSLGSAAGGILFPPKGPDGARLNELSVQSSTYGKGIPIPFGTDRIAGNIIWADKIQEHKDEHGGKGGPTYTTYSYTCSFASSICTGPIVGILRIWADGLLIYDRRPTATGEAIGFSASSHKIYLGDETQLPDPTIQAIIGDTPAYRGQAYIVFADLQLEKFGNRIPSLSFEYVTSGSDFIPAASTFGEKFGITPGGDANEHTFTSAVDTKTGHLWITSQGGHARLDPATGKYVIDPNYGPVPQIQEYDIATKEILRVIPLPMNGDRYYNGGGEMVYSNGYMFIGAGKPSSLVANYGVTVNTTTGAVGVIPTPLCAPNGAFYWPTVPIPLIDNNGLYMAGGNGIGSGFSPGLMPQATSLAENAYDAAPDRSGDVPRWNLPAGWTGRRNEVAQPPTTPVQALSCEVSPLKSFSLPDWAVTSHVLDNPPAVIVQGYNGSGGSYLTWISHSTQVASFNTDPPAHVNSVNLPGSSTVMPPIAWDAKNGVLWAFSGQGSNNALYSMVPGPGSLTLTDTGFAFPASDDVKGISVDPETGIMQVLVGDGPVRLLQFDPATQTVLQDITVVGSIVDNPGKMWVFPKQSKVIFTNGYAIYDLPYGSPLNANPVNLGAIVANLSERAGLALTDIDVSELTDMVDGYTITHQMAARSAIEPLMQAYFFDPVESDYQIKFKKRGRPSVVTIPDDDLAAHSSGSEPPDLVQVKRKQELDLPQSVSVKYKNAVADYQTSVQYEARQSGRSNSPVTVDIPIVLSDEKAKQVAAAALYSAWAERTGLTFATSLAYAALEPTDMAIVHNRLVRIVHRKRNGGILEWEAYADGNTIYPSETINQGGAPAPAGPVDQVIPTIPATQLVAIDAPITMEGTTTPSLTFAVQGTSAGFTGAQIWKSIDGGVSYSPIASAPNASLIGTAATALGAWAGGDTFDETNTVTVSLRPSATGATLSSATEEAVLNGANAALLGDEVLQYKRAVLNDNGTYTLSGLLRYRRGTDYATHTSGERFVPLTSNLVQIPVSTAEIGLPRQYKAVSSGGTLAEAQPVTLTYAGADLKPYSPVHVGGGRAANGDLTLNWVRRTRVGGEWRDGVDVPLGEASEAYDIEILNGAAVVHTFSGVTAPSVTYTAAQQVADFGSAQSTVSVRVYQLSSVVGRGFPGVGSV